MAHMNLQLYRGGVGNSNKEEVQGPPAATWRPALAHPTTPPLLEHHIHLQVQGSLGYVLKLPLLADCVEKAEHQYWNNRIVVTTIR
jgi:hypothetical protein